MTKIETSLFNVKINLNIYLRNIINLLSQFIAIILLF